MFDRIASKISGFLIACRLCIRIKVREVIIKDLEAENLIYATVDEFPVDLKEEFRERDDKMLKVAELKK